MSIVHHYDALTGLYQVPGECTAGEALAEAQELGYAEAVPDADVLGFDALAKVTILANTVFGAALAPDDSPCVGITEITPNQIEAAAAELRPANVDEIQNTAKANSSLTATRPW